MNGPEKREFALNAALSLLMAACVAALWLVPLRSSFWVDEMVTEFVVRRGASDPSLSVARPVTESIYYYLPRAAERLFGFSELVYRVPSLLAIAVALILIAKLAARLVHPRAAWFAAFACFALRGINYQADDARPYGLATCVAAASLWFEVRWLDSGAWGDAAGFLVFAALLWRVHLILWPFYLIFALYAGLRLVRRETPVSWPRAAAVFAVLAALLLPVLHTTLSLLGEASQHVIADVPSWRDLRAALKLGLAVDCLLGGIVLVLFRTLRRLWPGTETAAAADSSPRRNGLGGLLPRGAAVYPASTIGLIAAYWLLHPLCLYLFSHVSGNSVFLPRYLSVALPGTALAATAVAGVFLSESQWKPMALVLGAAVLLNTGQWRDPWPRHDNSDWRGAVAKIRDLDLDPKTPVICPSPFVEAKAPAWRPDYPLPGFLYSHLLGYPVPGKPYLFPFERSPEADRYAAELSSEVLPSAGRFVIYGGNRNVLIWSVWFASRPEFAGWQFRRLGKFGDVEAVVFEQHGKQG